MRLFFRICGALAGALLVLLTVVILLQIFLRGLGIRLPGANEIAGYCLAGSIFMALAFTLHSNGHIRVEMLLNNLSPRWNRFVEAWCYAVGLAVSGILALYATMMTWDSFVFGSMSPGLLRIPLWIPQTSMAVGSIVLVVAFVDGLIRQLARKQADAPQPLEAQLLDRAEQ